MTQEPTPQMVGKGKGKGVPVHSKAHPKAAVNESGPFSSTSQTAEADTLASLKASLEQIQTQVAMLQSVDGSTDLTQTLQEVACKIAVRIASMEPPPKVTPLHAQAQKLQWKINKKTKQVHSLKERIVVARRHLRGLDKQYQDSQAVLTQLRTQWEQIGPALIDPPSPLPSETEHSEAEDFPESGQEDPDTQMSAQNTADEMNPNEWQQPKRRFKRPRVPVQLAMPGHQTDHQSCHSHSSNLD